MLHTTRAPGSPLRARSGMTLIELLVAMSIIAILLALSSAAVMKVKNGQNYSRTREGVEKYQKALLFEFERINSQHRDDVPEDALVAYCDNNEGRAKTIRLAIEQRRYFPQTFAEATTYVLVTTDAAGVYHLRTSATNTYTDINGVAEFTRCEYRPLSHFAAELNGASPTGNANEESGALLYIILAKQSTAGGGAFTSAADDVGVLPVTVSFGGKSLTTYGDGFRQSIGFTRWDFRPEAQSNDYRDPKSSTPDPLDNRGLVSGWSVPAAKQSELSGILGFYSGMNRLTSVYSYGQDGIASSDDIIGFRFNRTASRGFKP